MDIVSNILNYFSLTLLQGLWYLILVILSFIIFFGRRDIYIRAGVLFLFFGYILKLAEGNLFLTNTVESFITRIGYTILLARLATRLGREKIE